MRTYQFETRVTALSSISHNGGESFGINSKLRREKFVQPDGSVIAVPVISGNSMRGLLRDRGMLHMCRVLGYGVDYDKGEVRGLPLKAFHFLFSGGSLTSDGGKVVNVEEARRLRELIPLVSIFGGGLGNQILPGKFICGKLIPVCNETLHLLPEGFRPERSQTIWEFLQEEMYTRKDDSKNQHLRGVIEQRDRLLLEAAESKSQTTVQVVEETGAKQQMMYYVETFAAGCEFYWRICLRDVSDVEFEAFLVTLTEFSRLPFIGGKSNVGMGEVALRCKDWFEIDSRLNVPGKGVSFPAGNAYAHHLSEKSVAIREFLGAM